MIQIETILDILWKGFIIGVIVSAPLGPVGVLCIQRTLNKGRWYGFVTGVGASLSDICYALLTGYMAIIAGALTWWFGITYFVNKVRKQFNLRGIWMLNRIIGSIVVIVSLLGLGFTLMGESLY